MHIIRRSAVGLLTPEANHVNLYSQTNELKISPDATHQSVWKLQILSTKRTPTLPGQRPAKHCWLTLPDQPPKKIMDEHHKNTQNWATPNARNKQCWCSLWTYVIYVCVLAYNLQLTVVPSIQTSRLRNAKLKKQQQINGMMNKMRVRTLQTNTNVKQQK